MEHTPPINQPTNIGPITNWVKIWGSSATADNSGVIPPDPYAVAALVTLMKELQDSGGRLMKMNKVKETIHIMGLFTVAAATASITPWGFDRGAKGPVEVGPEKAKEALGIPFNYGRNSSAQKFDIATGTAGVVETVKLSFESGYLPFRDAADGTIFFCANNILEFPHKGLTWLFATVSAISTGNLVLLARTY